MPRNYTDVGLGEFRYFSIATQQSQNGRLHGYLQPYATGHTHIHIWPDSSAWSAGALFTQDGNHSSGLFLPSCGPGRIARFALDPRTRSLDLTLMTEARPMSVTSALPLKSTQAILLPGPLDAPSLWDAYVLNDYPTGDPRFAQVTPIRLYNATPGWLAIAPASAGV